MIYVDMDNTLINTPRRVLEEVGITMRYGITADDYYAALRTMNQRHGVGSFNYKLLFAILRETKPELSETLIADLTTTIAIPMFVDDSLEFMARFPKNELTLLTTGDKEIQWAKVRAHQLESHIGKILIVTSPKALHIDTPTRGSYYIDDAPRELDAMKIQFPDVTCIQVREPAPWETQRVSLLADLHCADLLTVADMIHL